MSENPEGVKAAPPAIVKVGCPKCGHYTLATTERGKPVVCAKCETKLLQFGGLKSELLTITPF